MNSKKAKKLKKMAKAIALGKPDKEVDKIYNRLKSIHKSNSK